MERLTPGCCGIDELLFQLVSKIPKDVMDECRTSSERNYRTLIYKYVSVWLQKMVSKKSVTSTDLMVKAPGTAAAIKADALDKTRRTLAT